MVTEEKARIAARDYAVRNKTGWSEKFTTIEMGSMQGRHCYVVETSNIDFENKVWYEIETSTPVIIYIDASTAEGFGHQFGNRGFIRSR